MRPSSRPVLIVNHWGGVPRCLHGNVLSLQTWKNECTTRMTLPNTNCIDSFWSVTGDVWRIVREEGWKTACFGCTGQRVHRRNVRHNCDTLPDPRRDLQQERYIEVCSSWDGAELNGPSLLHDERAVGEALSYLHHEWTGEENVVLCVCLLSCADVLRFRFDKQHISEPERECCVLPHAPSISATDQRSLLIPNSLHTVVNGISGRFTSLNHAVYGETAGTVKDGEYLVLVEKASAQLVSVQTLLAPLIALVLSHNGHVCMLGSSSFSLGEYGCRDGDSPFPCSGRTFFCSTQESPGLQGQRAFADVRTRLNRFIEAACNLTQTESSLSPPISLCITKRDGMLFQRVDVTVRSHNYICLVEEDTLIRINDVDEDPLETRNILKDLPHAINMIISELQTCLKKKIFLQTFFSPEKLLDDTSHASTPAFPSDEGSAHQEVKTREDQVQEIRLLPQEQRLSTYPANESGGREAPPSRRRGGSAVPQTVRARERKMSAMRDR